MPSAVDPYKHLLGEVPDEKIAEMADVKPATVAKYRRELEAEAEAAEAAESDSPDSGADPESGSPDSEADDATDDDDSDGGLDARSAAILEAAEDLLDRGYRLVDGQFVPPARKAPEEDTLLIRLTKPVRYQTDGPKGKRVTLTLARSLYRGAMARKVLAIAPEKLVERLRD